MKQSIPTLQHSNTPELPDSCLSVLSVAGKAASRMARGFVVAAMAVLAIGLASTSMAAPVVVFQADLNGNRGTANTGPVQSGWTGISGTETAAPWTHSYSINGIAIVLAASGSNNGLAE